MEARIDRPGDLRNWRCAAGFLAGFDCTADRVGAAGRRIAGCLRRRSRRACGPPLSLFKALLIAVWHDLSDVRLAEALEDRASFRRFCGFSRHEPTPERTTFVRFRRELVARGLDAILFETVTDQLRAKAVAVKTGTLIDATVIGSASETDTQARWSGHRARKAIHGYKAHVAADADTALVDVVDVTPGHVHDGRAGVAVSQEGATRARSRSAACPSPATSAAASPTHRPAPSSRLSADPRFAAATQSLEWSSSSPSWLIEGTSSSCRQGASLSCRVKVD